MSITSWPLNERPRERLQAQGAAALSDAELLAIFLRVGVTGKSAVDLARDLLAEFGSLNGLFSASRDALMAVHGMGEAKYVQLQAVLEMAKRAFCWPGRNVLPYHTRNGSRPRSNFAWMCRAA